MTSGYAILNSTLSTAEEDTDFDNKDLDLGLFNRDEAYTFAVGYEDLREGLGEDLKGVLALLNGVTIDKIKIQQYNLSDCYISYNTSEALVTKMKGWIDEALEDATSAPLSAGMGSAVQSFSSREFIGGVSQKLRHSSISFGNGLKQFGERSLDWIRGIGDGFVNTVSKAGSHVFRSAKTVLKSTISDAQKAAVRVKDYIGTGVNNVITKGVSVIKSAVGKVLQIFSSPLLWIIIGVIIIAAIVFGPRIVRAAQGTL